jgi:hypothetical protein
MGPLALIHVGAGAGAGARAVLERLQPRLAPGGTVVEEDSLVTTPATGGGATKAE